MSRLGQQVGAHTPGPWNDRRLGSAGKGLPRSHEEQVCNGEGVAVFIVQHDGGTDGHANVALACAAPDLLAACEVAELYVVGHDTVEGLNLLMQLRAAIARATWC